MAGARTAHAARPVRSPLRASPAGRFVVGVVPPAAYDGRRRLFGALEQVFPVRFEGRTLEALRDVDGVVAFDSLRGKSELLPDAPLLAFHGSDRRISDASGRVEICRVPAFGRAG